jgi:hypothetical protein
MKAARTLFHDACLGGVSVFLNYLSFGVSGPRTRIRIFGPWCHSQVRPGTIIFECASPGLNYEE